MWPTICARCLGVQLWLINNSLSHGVFPIPDNHANKPHIHAPDANTFIYYPRMPTGNVDISFYCFLFYFFVILCVCTVTHFFAKDKASGVEFYTAVHRRPGQGIFHFGELCSHRSQKSDESASHREVNLTVGRPTAKVTLEMRRSCNMARRVDV